MEFTLRSMSAIDAFARLLQLPEAKRSEDGTFSFHFERAGKMTFSPSKDGSRVILSLTTHQTRPQTAQDLRDHFARAQFDNVTMLPITAGLNATGTRVLAVNIPEQRFDLQTVEACLDRLINLMAA